MTSTPVFAPPTLDVVPGDLAAAQAAHEVRVIVVGYFVDESQPVLDEASATVVEGLGVDAFALLDRRGGAGSAGATVEHEVFGHGDLELLVLVSLGDGSRTDVRRAGAAVGRVARSRGVAATGIGVDLDADQLQALAEGLTIGPFVYELKSGGGDDKHVTVALTGLTRAEQRDAVERGRVMGTASWRARTYAITPSNLKSPAQMEAWAREAAVEGALDIELWDDKRLAAEGFGGILAVGAGSAHSSRMIRLDYVPSRQARRGRRGKTPHVVLVGKAITFDTGGLSLKPRTAMENMKRDMTGGAVVIATMAALKALDVPVRVTGLIASAENSISGSAMRPGDVVRHYGGRTSVVNNTDAEGRLVMADALAYADAVITPDRMIDVATLTGAGKVALGLSMGALFASDDTLADSLRAAGDRAGEPVWRLPISNDYAHLLDGGIADADNAAGSPGATTAAMFLEAFTGGRPWAHLDIASVGDAPADKLEYTKGATGFGARLLLHHLTA